MLTSKSSPRKKHITIGTPKETSCNSQQARSNTIITRFASHELQHQSKVPSNTTSSYQTGKSSSAIDLYRKSSLRKKKVHVTESKLNLQSKMSIPRPDGSYEIDCKNAIYEPSSHPKTSLTGNYIRHGDEKYSSDVVNVQEDLRTNVLRALSNEEKVKFMKLETAVAKLGFPYDSLALAQFLIVSHGDLGESLGRMKSLQEIIKEYKIDKVNVADAVLMLEGNAPLWSIGGYDSDGRRIHQANFGKIPAAQILEVFPTFSKGLLML